MRGEVAQPLRSVPVRVARRGRHRSAWRCGPASSRPEKQERGSAKTNGTRSVLVIDDELSIRMLCRVNLAASGVDVLEAADGEDGIEIARSERPDLILLDVMMPGLDGWEVARRLGEDPATSEIPIVFLTARAGESDRARGQQAGGVGYVVKPFDPVDIGDVVEDVLTRLERGEREQLCREVTHPPEGRE